MQKRNSIVLVSSILPQKLNITVIQSIELKILKAKNKNKFKAFKPSPIDPTPDFSGGNIGGDSDWTPLLNRDYQIYQAIPSN